MPAGVSRRQHVLHLYAQAVGRFEIDEQHPDPAARAHVAEREEHPVAVVARERQCGRIDHVHETGVPALIGAGRLPLGIHRSQEEHVPALDERPFGRLDLGVHDRVHEAVGELPGLELVLKRALLVGIEVGHATLLVAVGILAAIAGPPFRDFVIQQNIRNTAFELMSDLTYARSEAVKRNEAVTVSKVGTGTWGAGGWKVAVGGTTLRQHAAVSGNVTLTMASSSIDFNLNGRASSAASFTIDDLGGKASITARCVSVDLAGRPQSSEGSCP